MDGNPPQQPVKLARKYTKQPPPLQIPSLESIRARGSASSSNSPIVPSPSSASTQVSLRAQKRSKWRKMDDVFRTYGFDSLGEFLSVLFYPRFRGEKDCRTRRHRQAVSTFLRGRCTTTMADIIPLIYNHNSSRPKQKHPDQRAAAFSPYKPLREIRYARPCLAAWATRVVGDRIYQRVGKLAHKNRSDPRSRRHLRATSNGRSENADVVDWEDVKFSIEELADLYKKEDPFLWYITECFSASRKNGKVIVKKTRPHPIVCASFFITFFALTPFLLQI